MNTSLTFALTLLPFTLQYSALGQRCVKKHWFMHTVEFIALLIITGVCVLLGISTLTVECF